MTLLSDIRLAVRGLLHVPAFTAAAIVSLTLGIATSAVVFGLVDAALLRPLPFAGSDRLMMLNITQTGPTEGEQRQRWSWQRFLMLRENVTSFADIASHSNVVLTLTGVAEPATCAGRDRVVALFDDAAGASGHGRGLLGER